MIDPRYPADEIFGIIMVTSSLWLMLVVGMVLLYKKHRSKKHSKTHVDIWDDFASDREKYWSEKDRLRARKEQDAHDQETLDKATEYHNDIGK